MTRSLLRRLFVTGALLLVAAPLLAHDMFLRLEAFFLAPNTAANVRLFNGTFILSENSITPDRLNDIAVVSPAGRAKLDVSVWNASGDTSVFPIRTGAAGTYVLGVSTKPRVLEMSGPEFNAYLSSDGIPDELAYRRARKLLDERSKERYEKHVKALVQVGTTTGPAFGTVLGYPAELVPLANPYAMKVGDVLQVRALVDGRPAANQFVQYGGLSASNGRVAQRNTRSDASGIVRIPLDRTGTYYVKFINMTRVANDAAANHHSKWASLTFAVR
ncbi:MAG: DUF4198 domain-containing protein [Gemmatimonadaceae bacterium]|nr:DUF4198 domain-containing protein [Gemmatimonadaceae bacterium]